MTDFRDEESDEEPRIDRGITEYLDTVGNAQDGREESGREEPDQTHHGEEGDSERPVQAPSRSRPGHEDRNRDPEVERASTKGYGDHCPKAGERQARVQGLIDGHNPRCCEHPEENVDHWKGEPHDR